MKFLAIISGLIAALMVSLMLSGCSQKGENLSNQDNNVEQKTEQLSKQDETPTKLTLVALPAIPSDNKSAGVKTKKTDVKIEEPKTPEVKTEETNKNPRLADDSAMDPKNKFPENYNGK